MDPLRASLCGVLAIAAVACGGGYEPSTEPTGVYQPEPPWLRVVWNQSPVYWTPTEVRGQVAVYPLSCNGNTALFPSVTWENLTTGESGAGHVDDYTTFTGACGAYTWWLQVPLPTFGTHRILIRAFGRDGAQVAQKEIETVRASPNGP